MRSARRASRFERASRRGDVDDAPSTRIARRRRRRRAAGASRVAPRRRRHRDRIFSFIFPRRARESGLGRTARRRRARRCASAARRPRRTRAALWRWSGYAERCTWCLTCACGLRDVRCDVCSGNAPEVNNCRFLGQPGRSSDAETRLRRRTEE
eukprot:30926-Pelagococcus_subviridis.AAC.5